MTTREEVQREMTLLRLMVKGAYDLQALRIQAGLRLCANFRAKLKKMKGDAAEATDEEGELSEEALEIIKELKESYKRLTEAVVSKRGRTLPAEKGFVGDELISSFTELKLIDQYVALEREEVKQFGQMEGTLDKIPIYTQYLSKQRGIGPAMAGVLLSTLDPYKARHVSSFWKYSGLDVVWNVDNRGRSRRQEHLVERTYLNKDGKEAVRMGITYNPWLKTKLFTLASSFMRSKSPWVSVYDGYKHRLQTDPARAKSDVKAFKKMNAAKQDTTHLWTPGRVDMASKRYMVKMFLADLWREWRKLEGLPVGEPYAVAKLGLPPHGQAAE